MLIERQKRLSRVRFKHPIRVVTLGGQPRVIRTLTVNVSRKGLFLRMPEPLPMGTKVALSLEAGGRALALAQAEVVWGRAKESQLPGRFPGCGVRFTEFMHPRAEELVDYLVHNLDRGKPLMLAPPERRWLRWAPYAASGALLACAALATLLLWGPSDTAELSDEAPGLALVAQPPTVHAPPSPGAGEGRGEGEPAPNLNGVESRATATGVDEKQAATPPPSGAEGKQVVAAPLPPGEEVVAAPSPSRGAEEKQVVAAPEKQVVAAPRPLSGADEKQVVATPLATKGADEKQVVAPPLPPRGAEKQVVAAPRPPSGAEEKQVAPPLTPSGATEKQVVAAPRPPSGAEEKQAAPPLTPSGVEGRTELPAARVPVVATATRNAPPVGKSPAADGNPARPPANAKAPKTAKDVQRGTLKLPSGAATSLTWSLAGAELKLSPELIGGAQVTHAFVLTGPPRAVFDLSGSAPNKSHVVPASPPYATAVRLGKQGAGTRIVVDLDSAPRRVSQDGAGLVLTF